MASESHFTWLDIIPGFESFSKDFSHLFGKTFIYGEDVHYVSHIFLASFVVIGLTGAAFWTGKRLRDPQKGLLPETSLNPRIIMEIILGGVMNLMEGIMGKENAERFLPLLGSLALFILFSNLLGLIPGFLPPTDNLNTTIACAVTVFVMTHVVGFQSNGIAYLAHFTGPAWGMFIAPIDTTSNLTLAVGFGRKLGAFLLGCLMVFVEIISHLIRPLSLSLRLMGNMVGDHKVLTIFLLLVPLFVPIPFYLLGLLVSVVQTVVFCLLSMVYISLSLEHEEEEH